MKPLGRRRILSGALASSVALELLAAESPARADAADVLLLVPILAQSIQQAISLANLVVQTANQVRMMTTMLEQVSRGSFPALLAFLSDANLTYGSLTSGIQSMSYRMAHIDSDFQKLFPSGAPPGGTTVSQHRADLVAWNQEVVGAAQIASRQQTTLSTLDTQASQTQTVLEQSQAASGVVEQLQLIAQLIGITNGELIVLNQTLATTGRVMTDLAAQGASERQLSLGKGDDARAGYTDKGAPVPVPTTLP